MIKRFNEMNIVDNISASKENTNGIRRVVNFTFLDEPTKKLFQKQIKMGTIPYYFNSEYKFEKVPLDRSNIPICDKKSTYMLKNPYGVIYFLNDEELSKLKPTIDKTGEYIKLTDERKKTLLDLVSSLVYHVDELPPK